MKRFWLNDRLFEEAGEGGEGGGTGENSGESAGEGENVNGEEGEEGENGDAADPDELSEDELKNAKGLFKLLKDPSTQKSTLSLLAQKAGLFENPVPTKKEAQEIKRDVKSILTDKLGKDYMALFGEKLSDALDEIVNNLRDENKQSTQELSVKAIENEVNQAFQTLDRETKGDSVKYRQKMTELADKLVKSENTSTVEYLRLLYSVAAGANAKQSTSKQIADKINRNRTDATSRTASSGAATNKSQQTQPKGLRAIVEAAVASSGFKAKG